MYVYIRWASEASTIYVFICTISVHAYRNSVNKIMAWILELIGKEKNLLNIIDRNTTAALNKTDCSVRYIDESQCISPVGEKQIRPPGIRLLKILI